MKKEKPIRVAAWAGLFFLSGFFHSAFAAAGEVAPKLPQFTLNGRPAEVTVQDLSGLGTRPLRLLVERNNRKHNEELIQVYALGAREGDDLRIGTTVPLPGMRVTLYKILQEPDGTRYLSMPSSVYFEKPGQTIYREKMAPFREVFFIAVFEKTNAPDEKEINVRYFEDRVRRLSVTARTNLLFSSLKLKMKDFADLKSGEFFERDAQLLVDRLIDPRRIFLVRIWKAAPSTRT